MSRIYELERKLGSVINQKIGTISERSFMRIKIETALVGVYRLQGIRNPVGSYRQVIKEISEVE